MGLAPATSRAPGSIPLRSTKPLLGPWPPGHDPWRMQWMSLARLINFSCPGPFGPSVKATLRGEISGPCVAAKRGCGHHSRPNSGLWRNSPAILWAPIGVHAHPIFPFHSAKPNGRPAKGLLAPHQQPWSGSSTSASPGCLIRAWVIESIYCWN